MKQFLLIACLSFFTLGLSAQVVYVDADATGNGDGTSWANASTDLNVALLTATSGSSVWIADGTYTTPDTVSFFIDKELTVLGGFNGTETSADAADPVANITILSGDVMGNDVAGTYDSLAYDDNNRVLFITDTSSVASQYTVTLDGLTIANGGLAQDQPDGANLAAFAGGGVLSFAKLATSRLTFKGNRITSGSAIALLSFTANGSVLDGMTFDGNFSSSSRQLYLNGVNDAVISNSTFDGGDATQTSGFIQAVFTENLLVENCAFKDLTTAFSGAGIRTDQSDDVTLRACTFENLNGSSGGGVYMVQADDLDTYVMDEDDFVLDGCTVSNCTSTGRGGGITAFNTNIKLVNSTVSDNIGGSIGGGMYQVPVDARMYTQVIENTTFANNADNGAGGAICLLVFGTAKVNGEMTGSTFSGNTSTRQGGLAYLQGTNSFKINDCVISENVGGFGTIITRGLVDINVKNTMFEDNGNATEAFQGAGFVAYFDDGSKGMVVDSCEFKGNTVGDEGGILSGGAAIYSLGGDNVQVPVSITNTVFQGNAAADGRSAGAVYLLGGFDVTMDNLDFLENSAGGEGGAIALQRSIVEPRDTSEAGIITTNVEAFTANISNSTFYNQIAGTQGGAISTQRVGINLTNCAFALNNVGTDGAGGGAIILNGAAADVDMDNNLLENGGSFTQESVFINNTFVDNAKGGAATAVGDHVAVFQPGATNAPDSNSTKITLLNNAFILSSGAASFEVEPQEVIAPLLPIGNIIFESLGGNFFSGPNGAEFVAGANDTVEDNPTESTDLFIDPEANVGDFPDVDLLITDPVTDNPLINTAVVSALVPPVDIRGNPRGEAPDIGAFEADWALTDTDEPIENSSLKLDFYPNPTANVLNIRNNDPTILSYDVLVADQIGRVLKAARFSGTNGRIDMTNLPAGVYNLRLMVNGNIYSKQVVKQ